MAESALSTNGTVVIPFAHDAPLAAIGAFTDAATQPGVHCQWLYCIAVDDVSEAARTVVALGGHALSPTTTPFGPVVGCEDPQHAAFALMALDPATG